MVQDWMFDKLKEDIGEKRFQHSIGVMEVGVKLAKLYGVNEEKAALAGLLHDCAKYKDQRNLLNLANDFDIILDNVMKCNVELIHGPLGAKVARKDYFVTDKEILKAIEIHTTGKENMSLLEKIVFIADYIEPNRNFEGVGEVRQLAFEDLNESIIKAMDNTIKYVINIGGLLQLDTVRARNYLKLEKIWSEV